MSSEPVFVALGDIHLETYIWRKIKSITGDAFLAFRAFIDHAERLKVPAVIVGDLFDSIVPDSFLIQWFRDQMDYCREKNIKIYAIQGNHDKRPIPWYCAIHKWPIHIGDGKPVQINGLDCLGFDYATKDEIEYKLSTIRPGHTDCLFLHQFVKQATGLEGAWNCDLTWIPEHIPLCIMGDVHKELAFDLGTCKAYYTGAAYPNDISQIGPKSCMVVHKDLSIERIPLPGRPISKFLIETPEDLEDVKDWLKSALDSNPHLIPLAWCISLQEPAPLCLALQHTYKDRAVINTQVVADKTEALAIADTKEVLPELSLPALLSRLVDPDRDPFAFNFVLSLLDKSAPIGEVIKAKYERFISTYKK
jgi:DNA repair exonuclease SbcCD nuclease subunit